MKLKPSSVWKAQRPDSGMALVIVMGFVFLSAAFAAMLLQGVASNQIIARRQVAMEKALYVGEAGVERMVAYISAGGTGPLLTNGTAGEGSYLVSINVETGESHGAGKHVFSGRIKINPNNSPDNEFEMTLPDSSIVTRDDLTQDYPGYTGTAVQVHLKPAGNGNQNWFSRDGTNANLSNANTYDILAPAMYVSLTNDDINAAGKAMGKWWIEIDATAGTILSTGTDGDDVSLVTKYTLTSHGTVHGVTRSVTVWGLRAQTWAKYALWANDNRDIYFKDGESFWGAIHSNTRLYFSHTTGATNPPTFYGRVSSSDTQVGPAMNSTNGCPFYDGLYLGVPSESLTAVNFPLLLSQATLVLTGTTYVAMSGTNVIITNSRRGWTNHTVSVPPLVYVKTTTTGASATRPGDVNLAGMLDGRMTIVAERDINITNHTRYASDPKTNAACNDALGLITKRDVVIKTVCPDNLKLYAHILATGVLTPSTSTDGSFYVEDHDTISPSGDLIVHGGIAQDYRGAVGTFYTGTGALASGYNKKYTYDTRFAVNPPPFYPPLSDAYVWDRWKESQP